MRCDGWQISVARHFALGWILHLAREWLDAFEPPDSPDVPPCRTIPGGFSVKCAGNLSAPGGGGTSREWTAGFGFRHRGLSHAPLHTPVFFTDSVTEFDVRLPGQFREAITKISEGLDRGNWERSYQWLMEAYGGGTTDATLVIPAENWSGLAPPEKPLPVLLAEVYGEQEASDLMQQFATSIRSQTSYILRVRPDLSLP